MKKGFIEMSIIGIMTIVIAFMSASFFGGNYFNTERENKSLGAATVVKVSQGGTGWGNIAANTLLTGNGANRLATTSIGANLTLSGGVLSANGDGSVSDWNQQLNFGVLNLTPTTTIPVWFKDTIYASSTLIVSGAGSSTFAGALGVGTTTTSSP